MATTTMAKVDNILKEVYEGDVNDQLQSEVIGLKRIERTSEGVTHHVGGKYVRFPIRTKRNHGIGARNEMEALPEAQSQGYEDAQLKLKYLYGAIELTGQVFELADKDFQAFASALDEEVSGLKEGLRKDQARQFYGTNKGVMATATAAGTTSTFVVHEDKAIYLEEGMIIDIFTSADAARVANAEITGISDPSTVSGEVTITFAPAAGAATASGDYITRAGSRNKEITGLGQVVSNTGSLYGIDPATTSVWKSTVEKNGGTLRALTEGLMISTVDKIRRKGGGVPTVGFAGLGVRRAYFTLLSQQRRVVNTKEFTGGFSGLEFIADGKEIPIVADVDCPSNQMLFVNEKQIKLYNAGDWKFMDRDGSKFKIVSNSQGTFDAYNARMFQYQELGTHRRNAHALIGDLIEG